MLGATVGLKPSDIYDMEYWEFMLYIKGYQDVYFNEQMNLMKLAYNSGMFSRETKSKPKSLHYYLSKIERAFNKNNYSDVPVDVEEAKRIHDKIQKLKEMR